MRAGTARAALSADVAARAAQIDVLEALKRGDPGRQWCAPPAAVAACLSRSRRADRARSCVHHRHCVQLRRHFEFRGHVCMVFDKLGLSLYDFLRRNHYR